MSGRGSFGRGGRGGDRGRGGGFGGRGGGRGGFQRYDQGPPETVLELGSFVHAVEDEMLCSSLIPDKVPHFNAPIYLQNKSQIGKVDEILGPINEVYFSVKMEQGMVAASFKKGDKVYVSDQKLLPIERFVPKPKVIGGKVESMSDLYLILRMLTCYSQNEVEDVVVLAVLDAARQVDEASPEAEVEVCVVGADEVVRGVHHGAEAGEREVVDEVVAAAGISSVAQCHLLKYMLWFQPNVHMSPLRVSSYPHTTKIQLNAPTSTQYPKHVPAQEERRLDSSYPINQSTETSILSYNYTRSFTAFINQKSVIDSIVSHPEQDQFIIAATGSGKSILFELPAILPEAQGKTTVVFIPRIAIIRIELERLTSCGISVEARYKKTDANAASELEAQNQRFFKGLIRPSLLPRLLLVTPNQLEHTETTFQHILVQLYERGLIQRFVFDEIHMLVERLSALRTKFPEIPVTILSASLSPSTSQDLREILNLRTLPKIFPLDRSNIYYSVWPKLSSGEDKDTKDTSDSPTERETSQLVPILHLATTKYPKGSGLIYCRSKNACRRMAKMLSLEGVSAEPYDSELGDTEAGSAVFTKWIQNHPTVRVLVSTVALSSGVHKSDVYAFDDAFKVRYDTQYQTDNIYALLRLINFSNCRRRALLSYYGDKSFAYGVRNARCCDVCDSRDSCVAPRPDLNITSIACRVLRFYGRQKGSIGSQALAETLQKHFGAASIKETTVDMWKRIVQLLIIERYLEKDRSGEQGGGQVKLVGGPRTNNVLRSGGRQVLLPWSMRFREHYLGEPNKEWPLLWTEDVVEKLAEIDVDELSRDQSPDL
ncbi:H/ACA snoRNP pseudouridylase subunit [Ceratobasidium sp. 414]|nr:H/ACA snoRNP pseudouridylase subunit [Ceratobasidium sp. 414]